jgi:archaetidylinositol phosphate synthase
LIGRVKEQFRKAFAPMGRSLADSGVSPNVLTLLGPLVAMGAAITFVLPNILFAAFLMLLVGFVDALDGAVARASGRITAFGGVLDSICDRYADAILLFGLIWGGWCTPLWGILALIGSLLVSYARARAEAVGVSQLGIGIAERPERLILLIAGTGFQAFAYMRIFPPAPVLFGITLWTQYGVILVALLTHITVIQRTISAYRALAKASRNRAPSSKAADRRGHPPKQPSPSQ